MSNRYNKLYYKDFTKTYIACSKNCEVCKIWSKPNNIWKILRNVPISLY